MGIYAITGASSGIGAKTKELLIQQGHKVINIDLKDGDICVNLASQEGRQSAVDQLHTMCPDGLDGMICNAGVSGACGNLGLIISSMDSTNLSVGNSLYVSTKYALARWVRRVSATWAANGVRINAVAPGNVHTAMTATMSTTAKMALNALPIPTKYGQECLMAPEEIAEVMVFLASDSARGVNGNIMFVDGGTDALLNTEKVY